MYATILVALSLVLSPAPAFCRAAPASSQAAVRSDLLPPPPGPRPQSPLPKRLEPLAVIAVDTSTAGEEAEVLDKRLNAKVEAEMTAINVAKGEGDEPPRIIIKVSALGGDQLGWSYAIDINHADKTPIPGGSFRGQCVDCTENELVDRVGNDTRSLLPQLHAYIANYNAQIDAEQRRRDDDDRRRKAAEDEERRKREQGGRRGSSASGDVGATPMDPLCKAGIGALAVGVVGAGLGVGLALSPDRQPDPNIGYELRSTKIPGYVALGVGGAAIIAGVALLVLGNRRAHAPRTTLAPAAGRGGAMLVWSGRF